MTADAKRCLIATWDGGGNVPPALALSGLLIGAGHDVRAVGPESLASNVQAVGLEFWPCPSVAPWPAGVAFENDLARFGFIRDSPEVAADLVRAIEQYRPDLVVADCMMGAAFAAAEFAAVPVAGLVHVLLRPFAYGWGSMFVDGGPARAALGLDPLEAAGPAQLLGRADVVLAVTPEEFDVPGPSIHPRTHYVGPLLAAPIVASQDVADDPLVLISFGTTDQQQGQALPPVLEAVADLPVRGVLTLGGVRSTVPLPVGPNTSVHDYLPHAQILGSASVVVSHGGLSTVMAALAHGVPLVCLPQGRDQGANAGRVQDCGVGLCVTPDASRAEIAAAIEEVLHNPGYTDAARAFGQRMASSSGSQTAVDNLESLVPH